MLQIQHTTRHRSHARRGRGLSICVLVFAIICLLAGGYLLLLTVSPLVAPYVYTKPIDVKTLPKPHVQDNRIIIGKIGVNIPYGTDGKVSLDRGAWWRYPERGNPADGGNFIIAAHRFSIQPTPRGTIEKSPFYNIDKLAIGDDIVVDYKGERYGYQITKIFDVRPDQTEIEAKTTDTRLTLYSCELGGSEAGRIVIVAQLKGKVAL